MPKRIKSDKAETLKMIEGKIIAARCPPRSYIAHQEQEPIDPFLARTELENWIGGLAAIYKTHHG